MHWQAPSLLRFIPTACLLCMIAVLVSGCINLERFRHEKYSCSHNRAGLDEIIVRRAKKGADVNIVAGGKEISGQITAITDEAASISYENINLTLNRKTGAITLADKNRYYRLNCTVSVFTL